MKRLMLILLSLALCAAVCSAMAANITLAVQNDYEYLYVRSIQTVGDTLYLMISTDDGTELRYWREGMDAAVSAGMVVTAESGNSLEDLENGNPGLDAAHAISNLFTDGQRLMSLNPFNGLVFEISVENNTLTYTDVVTVSEPEAVLEVYDDWAYLKSNSGTAVAGNTLYWLVQDWDDETGEERMNLARFDLTTGATRVEKTEDVNTIIGYKDGKLLLATRDHENVYDDTTYEYNPLQLVSWDPATDEYVTLGDGPRDYRAFVAYSDVLDAPVWLMRGRVMMMTPDGETKQVGYLPMTSVNGLAVVGKNVVGNGWQSTVVREMDSSFSAENELILYNSYNQETLSAFSTKYPNVPVYQSAVNRYTGADKLLEGMRNGDMDVLSLTVSYGYYKTLRDRGYCADLSASDEITKAVERMYPVFADVLKDKNGKIVAIPQYLSSEGWSAQTYVMDEMGLTVDELPDNYVDLVAFLNHWDADYEQEYPNYTPIEVYYDSAKEQLYSRLLNDYMNWCQATGQDIKFDTPTFRAAIAAVEDLKWPGKVNTESDDEDSWVYYDPLIQEYGISVFDFDQSRYAIPVEMRITPDAQSFVPATMTVLIVNPWSTHQDMAIAYLETMMENWDVTLEYSLFADASGTVLNPDYDRMVEGYQKWIDVMKEEMEKLEDEDDRANYQEMLDSAQKELDEMEKWYRYTITEEGLAHYQNDIVPQVTIIYPTPFSGSDEASADLGANWDRFKQGQMSLEEFIRATDQKLWMIQMENK